MRRKICSILLVLSLLCALLPSAAAEEVVPGPPPWVPETEYAVFPGSAVYQSENWALIETLRADAAAGELRPTSGGRTSMYQVYAAASALPEDAGTCFELGLIEDEVCPQRRYHQPVQPDLQPFYASRLPDR